jgi:hypothetical protein
MSGATSLYTGLWGWLGVVVFGGHAWAFQGVDVPEIEKFALATDRQAVLDAMVPGTDEHFWLTCLHHQHQGDWAAVDRQLAEWEPLHGQTERWQQIAARQAILKFDRQPELTGRYLTQTLGLRFDHPRRLPPAEVRLPQALDGTSIALATLLDRELGERPDLSGLSLVALERLGERIARLNVQQRRQLLSRVVHPDFPGLIDLVAQELQQRDSPGFGALPIHTQLTTPQLETLLQRVPALGANETFVREMVGRLTREPGPLAESAARRLADLQRIADFLRPLPASLNSLKAAVLHELLRGQAAAGHYDLPRFLEYIRLPRQEAYIHPARREGVTDPATLVDLSRDYREILGSYPPGNETGLIERYLQHFLADERRLTEFRDLLEEGFLNRQLAIAQILSGNSDAARWTRVLGPVAYRDLTQRVDLEFARTDKTWYRPDEEVQVTLHIKNIEQWVVRIYELNTLNCYRDNLESISASLSLEGLVPNIEKRFQRQQPPGIRTLETLDLPELQGRGVFLIDIIGGGKNARLLIRKGRLLCTTQIFAAGHALQVLDEKCEPLQDASVWVKGQRFDANEQGQIAIPFLPNAPAMRVILQHGDFADLADVTLPPEEWRLQADMHVEREALLAGQTAQVIIRPQLTVAGIPVSVANRLQDAVLTVVSTDLDGQRSQRQYRDFSLSEQGETTVPFLVPPRLRTLTFELQGKVRVASQSRDQVLTTSTAVSVNKIDTTSQILAVHLLQSEGQYLGQVVGRNGEPRGQLPVSVALQTRWSTTPVTVALQTNEAGQIRLGPLSDVTSLTLGVAGGETRTWALEPAITSRLPAHLTVAAGTAFRLPWSGGESQDLPRQAGLHRLQWGVWQDTVVAELRISDGWIHGPALPEGDYLLKSSSGAVIPITVIDGRQVGRTLINSHRSATVSDEVRPTIVELSVQDDEVLIRLDGVGPETRVHVLASRYVPAFPAARTLTGVLPPPTVLRQLRWDGNHYVSTRTLGDESLYILGRQGRERLAGSLLERPSLLLAPWALGETTSAAEQLARDQALSAAAAPAADGMATEVAPARSGDDGWDDHANLDFLAQAAQIVVGARPDADGSLRVPRQLLGDKSHLTVVVADLFSTLVAQHSLAVTPGETVDLRLPESLPLDRPIAMDKRIESLAAGQPFEVADRLNARFETVTSLADAWTLLNAAANDPELAKFEFLVRWADLDLATKHQRYQQHACHEVNFFLYRRDRAYFEQVIRPLIAQRRDATFFDQYLLEQDLTEWLRPWQFARLNVFEKLLLAQRLPEQRAGIWRQLQDELAMLPPDDVALDGLFERALAGRGLETVTSLADFEAKLESPAAEPVPLTSSLMGGLEMDRGGRRSRAGQAARPPSPSQINGRLGVLPADQPAAPAPAADGRYEKRALLRAGKELALEEQLAEVEADTWGPGFFGSSRDLEASLSPGLARRFYQAIQPTQPWTEYHYWRTQTSADTRQQVSLNRYWQAFAQHDPAQPFVDWRFLLCTRNVSEAILALALLDLDARSQEPTRVVDQRRLTWTSPQPVLVFHQQLQDLPRAAGGPTVMVSENFFAEADRFQWVDGRQVDKFISDTFYTRRLYGALVVVTNPTSTPRSVKLLTQVPVGAIAVAGSRETQTETLELPAFGSVSRGYWFYFPAAGEFAHFPAQVADQRAILASATATRLTVVQDAVADDRQTWEHVSQNSSLEELLTWLASNNLQQINLDDLLWRMQDEGQFRAILAHLSGRFVFSPGLWSYAVQHRDAQRLREFLEQNEKIPSLCGPYFQSTLVNNDAERRGWYEHIEHWPLVNARAHQVGLQPRILNPSLAQQYAAFLTGMVHRDRLSSQDRLAVVYFLLAQERIDEAIEWLATVNRDEIGEQMPFDYAAAWVALVKMDPGAAAQIADRYMEHPLPRWQQRFAAIRQVVNEASGAGAQIIDPDSALQQQTVAAAAEATVDVEATLDGIALRYRNADTLRLHYYRMDVELLFSRDPFGNQGRDGLTIVKPNHVEVLEIPAGETQRLHRLPAHLQRSNVMVEVMAGQQTATATVYANNLDVQVVGSMGQLQVRRRDQQQVLPATYVKVYGQRANGQVVFLKDGYTDLRGRFDYVTQSSTPLDGLQKLSILVSHDDHGSLIRQADLP